MGVLKALATVVAVAAVALAGGCAGDGTGASNGPTGTVHGTITLSGGMRGASSGPASGTVVAKQGSKRVSEQKVAEGQQFSFALPAGKYTLSADKDGLPCLDSTVTVAAGADQSVTLVCSIK